MTAREVHADHRLPRPSRRFFTWGLGVIGTISAFLGFFILFAGTDQSIGFGGDLSWTVEELGNVWGVGLLIAGAVTMSIVAWLVLTDRQTADQTHTRSAHLADLQWHAGVFVLVNAFLWIQDIAAGGGLDYAYWTTIPWGFGLAMHALAHSNSMSDRREPPREVVEEAVKELQHQ